MTQTEKFIARLHMIAAGSDPLDRQKNAVAELFMQFVKEAQDSLGDNRERIRSRLTGLQFDLTKQTLQPHTDRLVNIRDHARELVTGWLRSDLD